MKTTSLQRLLALLLAVYLAPAWSHRHLVDTMETFQLPKNENEIKALIPQKPLTWGDWNFISTTDSHGWLGGHGYDYNSSFSANWADFAAFVDRMRHVAKTEKDSEIFVVDSGDTHHGTLLSDNKDGKIDGFYTQEMIKLVDYDVLTIGNHELFENEVAQNVHDDFASFWGDKYITSNSYIKSNVSSSLAEAGLIPIGKKYRSFTGSKGTKVISFGFLFNFSDPLNKNPLMKVVAAQEEIQKKWFIDVLTEKPADIYLLAGHIPIRDHKVNTKDWADIVAQIRKFKPNSAYFILFVFFFFLFFLYMYMFHL